MLVSAAIKKKTHHTRFGIISSPKFDIFFPNSSSHLIFCVCDSTLGFHDAKFEFLFSNMSSHFIFMSAILHFGLTMRHQSLKVFQHLIHAGEFSNLNVTL